MKINRWQYLVNGVAILLVFGLVYAWSVFVKPLESEFGWLRSQTSMTFSISMAGFCLGGIAGGFMSKKVPARILLWGTSILILAGFILTSRISTLMGLYICYGVLIGFGVGVGYNVIMNITIKWFQDKQGLVSGILLMGFGFGGSVLGAFAVFLMDRFGWRTTFVYIGIGICVLVLLSSLLAKVPNEEQQAYLQSKIKTKTEIKSYTTGEMLKESSFWLYLVWATLLSAGGLVMISNASPFAQNFTSHIATATLLASLVNIFNGIGRISFGFLFDKLGSRKCLMTINIGFILSAVLLLISIKTGSIALVAVGICAIGFSNGGITPSNSAFVGKIFGPAHYAQNFSVANLSALISAFLGPYVSGLLQNEDPTYFSTLILIGIFTIISLPCMLAIKKRT